MCHTRELAFQIKNEYARFSKYLPAVKVEVFYGGVPITQNKAALKANTPHIVVGTPGRTLQLIKTRQLKTQGITMLVLDEADEMDMRGHRDDTRSLRKALPDPCQVLCFSATYTDEVCRDIEASVFKRHPSSKVLIANAKDDDRSELMVREIAHVWCDAKEHPGGKLGIVEDIYDLLSAQQSIIFVNTRKDCLLYTSPSPRDRG